MRTVDFSSYIVVYNFIIGVLLMLSSEKLGSYAGYIGRSQAVRFTRYTTVAVFTFGAVVAVLAGSLYVLFHFLRIGL